MQRPARELAALRNASDLPFVHGALTRAFQHDLSGPLSPIYSLQQPHAKSLRNAALCVAAAACKSANKSARKAFFESGADANQQDVQSSAKGEVQTRVDRIAAALQQAGLPQEEGDAVIQIGTSFRQLGANASDDENTIFVLGSCDAVDNTCVHTFGSEADMLRAFFHHLRVASPDFLTGYNVMGFDFAYIVERARQLKIDVDALPSHLHPALFDASDLSRLLEPGWTIDVPQRLVVTKGTEDRDETYFAMHGRVTFDLMHIVQKGHSLTSYRLDAVAQHFTGERKDDVSPAQIFASHNGNAADRAEVAAYCIQDCRLVLHLTEKLNTVSNALGMADVCGVPVSWIFLRGQGCKILSLVARQCAKDGFAVPGMGRNNVSVGYDGATVLDPEVGAYIDTPVVVLDFSSLYPSSMISHNISHDTFVGGCGGHETGDSLTFDLRLEQKNDAGRLVEVEADGPTTVSFVKASRQEGVIPRILWRLLVERKRVRGLIKGEPDPFRRSILDGLQLAYKVTANSLYGQLGAPTSPVFMPELAAATTAVGRQMLMKLREHVETCSSGHVVYGDTDSCFMVFPDACKSGKTASERIAASIQSGKRCSDTFRSKIPAPHDAEYEKTFWPFVLLSKKRYVGNLYEEVDSAPKRASMGIVLKRRDNADIVKHVYGGVIDRIMDGDIGEATSFAKEQLLQLVQGQVDVSKLIITKTLRAPSAYVDPDKIAHVVLARRMNSREPGSAPNIGERMPYVHIRAPKGTLQGNRIEHPDYLASEKIDYEHYLTNQLMKPLAQLFAVLIESLPGSRVDLSKPQKQIDAEVRRLVFADALHALPTSQGGLQDISMFFVKK